MHLSFLLSTTLLAALSYAQEAPPPAAAPAPVVSISPGPAPAAGNGGNQGAAAASPVAGQPAASSAAAAPGMGGGVIGQGGEIPVWVIKVSDPQNSLVFSPNTVTAKPGEMVQFQFYSRVSGPSFLQAFALQRKDMLMQMGVESFRRFINFRTALRANDAV